MNPIFLEENGFQGNYPTVQDLFEQAEAFCDAAEVYVNSGFKISRCSQLENERVTEEITIAKLLYEEIAPRDLRNRLLATFNRCEFWDTHGEALLDEFEIG